MVAPARSAMWRCVSGGITRSSVPITAQLGRSFHAPGPEGVVLALRVIGRWPAAISQRSASGRSWAKALCTVTRVLPETRVLGVFIVPFLLVAFPLLYFFPNDTGNWWAWETRPSMTALIMR